MRFSTFVGITSLLATIGSSSAKIVDFFGPSEPIVEGEPFPVTFQTQGDLTNNEQYYALFGMTTRSNIGPTIGSAPFANVDISSYPKYHGNFSINITNDNIYNDATEQTLATAIFGQVGASGGITVQYFNTTVKVKPSSSSSS